MLSASERLTQAERGRSKARQRGYSISLRLAYRIVAAADDIGRVGVPLGFALVETETGFKHIFGHDAEGLFPGQRVTRTRFRVLREHLRETWSGANGVGLTQITWPPFVIAHGRLWRPKVNLRVGFAILRDYMESKGREEGVNAYNGDPTGAYGRKVLDRAADYRSAIHR